MTTPTNKPTEQPPQQPAPAPDWLGPVTDAECATAILRTAQWTPATREAMDRLLAERADAYARRLASTDAGRLVSEGRELERKAAAALIEHASPWVARDLVVMDCDGLMVANCNSPEQGYSAIDNAVLIEACDPAKLKPLLTGLLALAEAAASDRAALATVTRERDEAVAVIDRQTVELQLAQALLDSLCRSIGDPRQAWVWNAQTYEAATTVINLRSALETAEQRAAKAEAALARAERIEDCAEAYLAAVRVALAAEREAQPAEGGAA